METLMQSLLDEAKKSKSNLVKLKSVAVKFGLFELGAKLREMENDLFPESEELKCAQEQAKKANLLFRMVDLNISEANCWLIEETLKMYNKKKSNFLLTDAVDLTLKKNELYPED